MALSSQPSMEKVREELSCSICFEQFQEPKMLPCFHTFCKKCLEGTKRSSRGNLVCPTCRTPTSVTEVEQVGKLPNNFIVNRVLEALTLEDEHFTLKCTNCEENFEAKWKCVDCRAFLCCVCYEAHNRMSLFRKSHRVVSLDLEDQELTSGEFIDSGNQAIYCDKHKDKELELYCKDCDVCVCTVCFATKHQGHELHNLDHVVEEHKAAIRKLLLSTEGKVRGIQEAKEDVEAMGANIDQLHENIRDHIHVAVALVTETANRKAEELLSQLHQICKHKHKVLDAQMGQLGLDELKIRGVQMFADEVLGSSYADEVLSCESQLVQRLNELTVHKEFGVDVNDFIDCTFDVTDAVDCIGRAFINSSNTIPKNTQFKVNKKPVEGEKMLLEVTTLDVDGNEAFHATDDVNVTVINSSGEETNARFSNPRDGCYPVTFVPQEPGIHTVSVTIRGRKAWKKAKSFFVSRNFMNIHHVRGGFGASGQGEGEFSSPTGVAVNDHGMIAVADTNNHRIQLFDTNEKHLKMFGREGKKYGDMRFPRAVAFSTDGSIIVLDSGNSRVQIFNQEGQFLKSFGREGTERGEFSNPLGLSVDGRDRIIVSDTGNSQVQVFDLSGVFQLEFGTEGTGKLRHPESAVYANDLFIVADTGNNNLKYFSEDGIHMHTLKSVKEGMFDGPSHVSADRNGFLVVCDRGNHHIKIISPDKAPVTIFSRRGSELGQLMYPQCSCVATDGAVIVADSGNHRVQIFN